MSEDEKSFTVTDRRHFNARGDVRQPEPERREVRPPEPAHAGEAAPSPVPHDERPPDLGRFDFRALLVSLGAQAGLLLGDLAVAGEEPPEPDLDGAREVIDLLQDLKNKTEGRRSPEEDQVLEGLLYDLRMRYVSKMGRR